MAKKTRLPDTPQQAMLRQITGELAKDIKTEADLNNVLNQFVKMTVEAALGAEMEHHLGYAKSAAEGHGTGNSRNGFSPKTLTSQYGELAIETPRDRNSEFEPVIVQKGQTRLTGFDDQILAFYAQGMTTREITDTFKKLYDADISPTLISKVTDAVIDRVTAWRSRPLDNLYPIVYMDCIVIKVHQDKRVINKSVYIALGVNLEGQKECLGLWIADTEGARTWLSILTELKNRGLNDILIACVDGLKGFPDAVNTVYPQTKIQLCIVHMVRNSLKYVSWKDQKALCADLKLIYRSATEEDALRELDDFEARWSEKYPSVAAIWRRNWVDLSSFFAYPAEIRKVIYTTNAIESLNSVIRKSIKKRKIFPHDQSALKVICLAIESASEKWTMPLANWRQALNHFMIEYPERMAGY